MNRGFSYQQMIAELPLGVERQVMIALRQQIGQEHAIGRDSLVAAVIQGGYAVSEREVRGVVNLLRKAGFPICSTGGIGGGYWLAKDWDELEEFLDREVRSRLADLREQELALKRAGERLWGVRQMELFG